MYYSVGITLNQKKLLYNHLTKRHICRNNNWRRWWTSARTLRKTRNSSIICYQFYLNPVFWKQVRMEEANPIITIRLTTHWMQASWVFWMVGFYSLGLYLSFIFVDCPVYISIFLLCSLHVSFQQISTKTALVTMRNASKN